MPTPPVPPCEHVKPASPRLPNLLLYIGALTLVAISVYLYFENMQLKKQLGVSPKPLLPKSCDYNGVTYQPGEDFPATDGCNSCSCSDDGEVACTLMACTQITSPSTDVEQTGSIEFKHSLLPFTFNYPSDWDYYINDKSVLYLGPTHSVDIQKQYGCEDSKILTCYLWEDENIAVSVTQSQAEFTSDEYKRVITSNFSNGSIEGTRYEITYLEDTPGKGPKGHKDISIMFTFNNKYVYVSLTRTKPEFETVFEQILSTFEFTE